MPSSEPQNELLAELNAKERKQQISRTLFTVAILLSLGIGILLGGLLLSSRERREEALRNSVSAAGWVGDSAAYGPDRPEGNAEEGDRYAPSSYQTDDVRVDPTVASADGGHLRRAELQPGKAVITGLTELGLTMTDAHLMLSALDGIYDFRRARPGHTYEVHFDPDTGKPKEFRYAASLVDVYEVKRVDGKFRGKKVDIKTTRRLQKIGGTIASSLYRSLDGLDAKPTLAGKIADVLSNLVNFYKEQRPGDTFRVVVEEETLGEHFLGYGPVLALEYNGVKSGRKRFYFYDNEKLKPTYYDDKGVSVPRSAISIPLHFSRISSKFGYRFHPVLKRKKLHNGVDFAAPHGTPVWTCLPGVVIDAGYRGANGNLVSVDHGNGLRSYYAHLQRFARGVQKGTKLRAKQVIGYVGSSGRSTGAHLHFGLKRGEKFLDPLKYKIQPGRPIAARYRKDLKKTITERSKLLDRIKIAPPSEPLSDVPDAGSEVLGLEEDL